jgi:hypothetical protein
MDDDADDGGKRSKSPSPQPHTPDITEGNGSSHHVSSGDHQQQGFESNLIGEIGRDLSMNCLLGLSRSDYSRAPGSPPRPHSMQEEQRRDTSPTYL